MRSDPATETDEFGQTLYDTSDSEREIVEGVAEIAAERGVVRAQVALAWVAQRRAVTAFIIGARLPHHLDDAVAALKLDLTDAEVARLEEPYRPHPVVGFS